MNSNIIEISKFRKKPGEAERWICDLGISETGTQTIARIINANVDDDCKDMGDRLREIADRLDDLAFIFRQFAERESKSERGEAIGTAIVFEDGTVRVRFNDDRVCCEESRQWLRDQFDLAKEADELQEKAAEL